MVDFLCLVQISDLLLGARISPRISSKTQCCFSLLLNTGKHKHSILGISINSMNGVWDACELHIHTAAYACRAGVHSSVWSALYPARGGDDPLSQWDLSFVYMCV